MTITRVQQVTAVLTGTSDTVTLPLPPSYGNTLIAVLAGAGSAPLATSLTQTNVTWVSLASGDNGDESAYHVFYGQNIGPGAVGQTVTVTRSGLDDYQVAVFEYDGLLKIGTLLDAANSTTGDGYSPFTDQTTAPTTQADELFLGLFSRTSRDVLLRDSLDSDAGYWRLDTSIGSSLVFTGGGADVIGLAHAETADFATWSNYSVAADVSGTSGFVSSNGWFGLALYGSGNYLNPTGNGFAGLINTLDDTVYAVKVVNGVITLNSYPYGSPLNPGQVYRLELRARTTSTSAVLIDFLVDGVVIFSETHTGMATTGSAAMAVSGANPTPVTFNNFEVLELSDRHIRTDSPTNGFVEVMESSISEAAQSRVMLSVYEKVSDVIDQPSLTVQAEDFVKFGAHIQTFFADLSSESSIARPVDLYVADNFLMTQSLDMVVAEAKSLTPLDLSIYFIDVVEKLTSLSMVISADGFRFVDLAVSIQPFRLADLAVSVYGTELATAALDLFIAATPPVVVNRRATLRVLVEGQNLRRQAAMDLAILVEPEPTDISTTPELARYLLCRPLWCNVPKEKAVWARTAVNVGGLGTRTASMSLHVQAAVSMEPLYMTVLIKPEP